jgi:cation diffusion facilitator family transporter
MNEEKTLVKTPMVRIGIYSLAVNLILVAAKLSLSFVTGSLALRADAIHSLVDVFASIALILGLVISGRKSRNFPYGLYKVENLVSAIISLLLFFTAYEIVSEAISNKAVLVPYGGWVLAIVAILILVPFFFGRYELTVGRKYNSPSLIADGSQFRADVLGSSIVFIGLLAQLFGFPLDRIAAGIIALFIVYAAWGLLMNSMRVLLDASISHELIEKIRSVIEAEPAVSVVRSLVGRNSGRYIFVEADINMRITDLKKAHLTSEEIERKIRVEIPNIDRVLIHYEPQTKTQIRYAVPLSNREGQLSDDFGKAPYFAVIDIDNKQTMVLRQEIIANPFREIEKGRGIMVAEFLLKYKPDIVIAKESLLGKGPGYALAYAGTETLQTEAKSLEELLDYKLKPN